MAAAPQRGNGRRPVVVRREEVAAHGHHAGAWKVAYADFVTAMMAFFLLMWLLNATTEAQRRGLADYFTPANAMSEQSSGSGKPFGGLSPMQDGHEISNKGTKAVIQGVSPAAPAYDSADPSDGTGDTRDDAEEDGHAGQPAPVSTQGQGLAGGGQASTASRVPARADYLAQAASGSVAHPDQAATAAAATPEAAPEAAASNAVALSEAALRTELQRRERSEFERAAQGIRDAIAADPALAGMAGQISIDTTPQGLRIQLLDADRTPMFATGSTILSDRARLLIARIAPVLGRLRQPLAISGHTDAAAYHGGDMTNWELSSARANVTRRLLAEAGLPDERFRSVSGNADRDPLLPADPFAAANRRIAITVLRLAPSGAAMAR